MSEEERSELTRREALQRVGGSGAFLLGTGVVAGGVLNRSLGPAEAAEPRPYLQGLHPADVATHGYGHGAQPPSQVDGSTLDGLTLAPNEPTREIEIEVVEREALVAEGVTMAQWTFNGTAPGPTIRATEGETVRVYFKNKTEHPHNLHFHGSHSPLMDGWEPIPPGGETIYEIEAGPAGVHPYHCHTPPLNVHVAKGLFGTLIVDPKEGLAPAREFVLMLNGWDVNDDGFNELYSWNGIAGYYGRFPLKVEVGEPVRLYVTNMTEYEPVASFHLHAQTFDVKRGGMWKSLTDHADTVGLVQGERAIIEFSLPELGRYMFHPHQHHMAANGAMGWIAAI